MTSGNDSPSDPTRRFSSRVGNYVRYRPGYPIAVVETLEMTIALTPSWAVADVGSGTGLSTEPFLRFGCPVVGVEPNDDMRRAAEERLSEYGGFRSVAGRAEATTLPDASVDLVVAGQAFHWFDAARARDEFRRILRKQGFAALFWNTRRVNASPFQRAYEAFVQRFATDYNSIRHDHNDEDALTQFFGESYERYAFPNLQVLDFEGLEGRVLSSSYMPLPDQDGHAAMRQALEELYRHHQRDGRVEVEYNTELFVGRVGTARG